MARHDELTRDMLLDVCGSLLDTDLNDPLPSIADLSDAQLGRVREGLLAWRRTVCSTSVPPSGCRPCPPTICAHSFKEDPSWTPDMQQNSS